MVAHHTLVVAALVAAVSLSAQTQPALIGIGVNPAAITCIDIRQNPATCNTGICGLPFPQPAAATPWAGGTAYDAAKGGVWMTNGVLIGLFDPVTCAPLCPPMPIQPMIGGNFATGLACNESTKTLFVSDNLNNIWTFNTTCPLTPIGVCPAGGVPAGMIIGGLATDDVNANLYYAVSSWAGAPGNLVVVSSQATPCVPRCRLTVQSCTTAIPLGAITGLAFNDCRRSLWATDGLYEVELLVTVTPAGCGAQTVACCKVPGAERYIGLCIEPSHATSSGASCTALVCAACPGMLHATVGDPALGNPAFALTLSSAPAGASSVLCFNAGPCLAAGLPIPPFCGPLHVPLPGIITIGFATGGGAGCTGGVNMPLPVPLAPALCMIPLATQFLVVCPGAAGFGTGASNCLSWMVTGT